ncbi:MAG: hypothetical protein OEO20_02290 [Gemmatimonadota bacterium]|nr:hypothetical protein [Gemmatimonadota bacterium]MDH3477112.1 hypothetical protein [Gemmatimonadota bacterium]MDH3569440.1 hypothetical protein [Gemmatimonadota bacterium]MDH5551672.1 hypothetical protein [Gemmatimonadota bacterium]
MIWVLGLVLLLALLIPLAAVLLDAPRRHGRLPDRTPPLPPQDDRVDLLARRLLSLEDDVETVARGLQDLRDEIDVVRQVLESGRPPDPTERHGSRKR